MKKFEVQDQVRLSLGKCVELVIGGIQYRLFRAMITVSIVALAVAFLMTMLSESMVSREVGLVVAEKTAPRRDFLFWLDRLGSPMTAEGLTKQLASEPVDGDRARELAGWGEVPLGQIDVLKNLALKEVTYLRWFRLQSEGVLRPLVGRHRGRDIFRHLADPVAFSNFGGELRKLGKQLPTDLENFQSFLAEWVETEGTREAILMGHARAVERLRSEWLGGQAPTPVLASAGEDMTMRLARYGFMMSPEEAREVQREAGLSQDAARLERLLGLTIVKQRLAIRRSISKVSEVKTDHLFAEVSSSRGARWLVSVMEETDQPLEIPAERVSEVAGYKREQAKLSEIEAAVHLSGAAEGGGALGFSSRVLWLLVVSLLVCVVGIANAMLMSVTERFNEIATMKCLGATDGFIMVNFILESCMQGLAGGLAGAVLGFVLGVLRALIGYGWIAVNNLPFGGIATVAMASIAVGVGISAMAAVYPAWVAARLAPMEAMRVE